MTRGTHWCTFNSYTSHTTMTLFTSATPTRDADAYLAADDLFYATYGISPSTVWLGFIHGYADTTFTTDCVTDARLLCDWDSWMMCGTDADIDLATYLAR